MDKAKKPLEVSELFRNVFGKGVNHDALAARLQVIETLLGGAERIEEEGARLKAEAADTASV